MNAWQRKVLVIEAGMIYTTEPIFASASALILPAFLSGWPGSTTRTSP